MAVSHTPNGVEASGFLTRLGRDKSGNTLALATAGIMALMGMVGGAVDMSRSYMVQSRLQQACDAGALSARKAMVGETLTEANRNVGYRYFDFNFPDGTLGADLISRTYTQPTSSLGTPQAVVNGSMLVEVPTTIMRAFGNETVEVAVTCSSKMEIQSADVAMVLDVTSSMTTNIRISSSGTASEDRINALHKAVRAFYEALGPGRAGGDQSRGRIRYAFVPYGTVVNVGYLLSHTQMVDSHSYQSREAVTGTVYGWTLGNAATVNNYTGWSSPPDSYSNSATYNSFSVVSGNNTDTFTMQDGTSERKRHSTASSSTACTALNDYGSQDDLVGIQQTEATPGNATYTPTNHNPPTRIGPSNPSTQNVNASQSRTATVTYGYRYSWHKNGGSTNYCWLERATKRTSGSPAATYSQTRTGTTTRPITWTAYTGTNYVYSQRTIDVSGLKALLGGWNSTVTVPALSKTNVGYTEYDNVTLSGSSTPQTVYTGGGTAQNVTLTWRGCVEERQMVNTITPTTSVDSIPTGANDLNSTLLAISSDNATRWRPWLPGTVFRPGSTSNITGEECPAPALRLQEIGDYDLTTLDTNYPMLFDSASGGASSYYYPYTTSQWGTSSTPANLRTKNSSTLRNYINRIDATNGLFDGTIHDAGFMWGLHLVSGVGMFAADNPDRFNGQVVNRNIVFMTDGEMNPGEERYVFSGYNNYDGRVAPAGTRDDDSTNPRIRDMTNIHNRRLRIQCEAAKRQGITVWVVAITQSSTSGEDYDDLRACASSSSNFKSAATTEELIQSFTTIANSIGGLRISR